MTGDSRPAAAGAGVIIAAAGSGRRFGTKKQFLELEGRPLLVWSLDVFGAVREVDEIAVVVGEEDRTAAEALVANWRRATETALRVRVTVVAGGSRRQESVQRGFETLGPATRWVLVHDAARPLVRPEEAERVLRAVREEGAAAIGHPATDSVKEAEEGWVARGLARSRIWQVQTPQGAARALLERGFACAGSGEHTDEVSLLEAAGVAVRLVEGSQENIKVTRPGDLELAAFFLRRRAESGRRRHEGAPPGPEPAGDDSRTAGR